MAETQPETPITHAEPPPAAPIKRGPGRPPKPPEPTTAAAPQLDKDTEDDFFAYLRSFPAADWEEKLFVYLYRTHPILNLGKKGEWRIERYNKPFDSQDVMLAHGSGGYKAIFDRWDPITGQTKIVRQHYFTIINMNYPPKVGIGTWLDREENKEWMWAKPALEAQLKPNGAPGAGASHDAQFFNSVIDAVERLRPNQSPEDQTTLAQVVITSMQENAKLLMQMNNPAQVFQMVEKILESRDGKGSSNSEGLMKLFGDQLAAVRQELSEERKFNRQLLEKLTAAPAQPGLRDQLSDFLQMADLIGLRRGGKEKSGTDWAEVALETGKELVKGIATVGTAFLSRQPGTPRPAPVPPGVQPAALPPAAAPAEPAPAGPVLTAEQQEKENMIAAISNNFGNLFDAATPFLVDHFIKGWSGMEFRDWFIETYGTTSYNAVRGMAPQTLVDVIEHRKKSAPEHIRLQLENLQPAERVMQFAQEFLSDRPADEEDEPESDDEPEPQDPAQNARPARRDPRAPGEF